MLNILVTGGAGYIGSITVEILIREGHNVIVVDNLCKGHKAAVSPHAKLIVENIGNKESVSKIIKDHNIDAVLHFAAYIQVGESMQDPGKYFDNIVCNGLKLIEAAAENKVKKFILSSTAAVYGEPEKIPITEDHRTDPANPYGESKLIMEKFLKWFNECHGMDYVALRYFNACGASEKYGEDHNPETHLIPLILDAAAGKRDAISVFGDNYPTHDGTCIRDYIHVIDLARAHILALENKCSKVYNLGNGRGFSVKEVIQTTEKVTGRKVPVKISPRRPGDTASLVACSDKIKKELGWQPEFASLEKIIESAWKWKLKFPEGYSE